jgi:hypothetical protein
MSVETDRAAARPETVGFVVAEKRLPAVTMEEADEARRHAAEIGDYVTAQRWLWHERMITDYEDRADRS